MFISFRKQKLKIVDFIVGKNLKSIYTLIIKRVYSF